ncbi:hypothetical protein EJ08DRAFT_490732 [Tothia fuscella]|uniref:Uncharacterized protein n=1 Tax=Tothia fuscella TaxID=1048955 RepID=A0A9P4NHI1_9PEZI|nr:hypothetical protein EJ08DRAFT_490732 [Tothia fuscella]
MPSATQVQCLILAVSSAAVPTLAFTNGTLVPAYICHPNADGLPKSLGQLLRFTREPVQQIGFSRNAKQNVAAPALSQQGNSKVMNSAYIIASLHDSPNNLTSINQGIVVRVSNGDSIKAGQANQLILSSGSAGVALKGALLYAQDTDGTRQGSFTDKSGANTFVLFRGCGKNPQGRVSGVIQQMGVSATVSIFLLTGQAWHIAG